MNVQDAMKAMKLGKSWLTSRFSLTRKLTVNENLADERRVYQCYYNVHLQTTEDKVLTDTLTIEALSAAPGEPISLRLTSPNGEAFVSEGSGQIAETILLQLDAAAHAEGKTLREYAEKIVNIGLAKRDG